MMWGTRAVLRRSKAPMNLPPPMPETVSPPPAPATSRLHAAFTQLRDALSTEIVGQAALVERLLIALLADGHLLVEGAPGLAKTTAIRALASRLEADFARVQFTPDLLPADLTGTEIWRPQEGRFEFVPGPIFHPILLADEINRAPAKTQSALLEVMQEGQVTIEGKAFTLAPPFMALATQNPLEQEGTYPLPEAQLDRFLLKVLIDYPQLEDEKRMVTAITSGRAASDFDLSQVPRVLGAGELLELQRATAAITVDDEVIDYAVRIVAATRQWPGVAVGAGPRGSIALVRASRAQAVLAGRDFVTPDDVRDIARPALRHRIALAPELQIEGQDADDVLGALLAKVEAPRR